MKRYIRLLVVVILMMHVMVLSNLYVLGSVDELPVPPRAVRGTSTESSVTVSWLAVSGDAFYEVLVNNTVYSTSNVSITIDGLVANQSYTVQVRTVLASGSSDYSSAIILRTFSDVPPIPTGISAQVTENSITVTWMGLDSASSYDVLINGSVNSTSGTSYTYSGLSPGTVCTYAVRAKNGIGTSLYTAMREITTNEAIVPVVVETPNDIRAISTEREVTISWSGSLDATSYEVRFNGRVTSSMTSFVNFSGLIPGSEYSYEIRAINGDRVSDYSSSQIIRTKALQAADPEPETETETNLEVEIEEEVDREQDSEPLTEEDNIDEEEVLAEEENELREMTADEELVQEDDITPYLPDESYEEQATESMTPMIISDAMPKVESIDRFHGLNQPLKLSWDMHGDVLPRTYLIQVFNDRGKLVYNSKPLSTSDVKYRTERNIYNQDGGFLTQLTLNDFNVSIPSGAFSAEGYYMISVMVDEDEDQVVKWIIEVSDAQTLQVQSLGYTKVTSDSYHVYGTSIGRVDDPSIVVGIEWGNTIDTKEISVGSFLKDQSEFVVELPELDNKDRYYYRAFVIRSDGTKDFGAMMVLNPIEGRLVTRPAILNVFEDNTYEDTVIENPTLVVTTDISTDYLVIYDQDGVASMYKNNEKTESETKLWTIRLNDYKKGIIINDIYAFNDVGVSVKVRYELLLGSGYIRNVQVNLTKDVYQVFQGSSNRIRLRGDAIALAEDDFIRKISLYYINPKGEQVPIVSEAFNEHHVELSREILTFDLKSASFDDVGIYPLAIYVTTDKSASGEHPLGTALIKVMEQLSYVGLPTDVVNVGQAYEQAFKGEIKALDGNRISQVTLYHDDEQRSVHGKKLILNSLKSVVPVEELYQSLALDSSPEVFYFKTTLNDNSSFIHNVTVYQGIIEIECPDIIKVGDEVDLRVYMSYDKGRSVITDQVTLKSNDESIAVIIRDELIAKKAGSFYVSATYSGSDVEVTKEIVIAE